METLLCDVIGCGRPAAWVRVERVNSNFEDFLCAACQENLHRLQRDQALCYIPCDLNAAPSAPASYTRDREVDAGEDVILIGA